MVDVSGIDRKVLLKALWYNAIPQIKPIHLKRGRVTELYINLIDSVLPTFSYDDNSVDQHIQKNGYVDYLFGRAIKADVFGESNVINPRYYDYEYGDNAFLDVVQILKQ